VVNVALRIILLVWAGWLGFYSLIIACGEVILDTIESGTFRSVVVLSKSVPTQWLPPWNAPYGLSWRILVIPSEAHASTVLWIYPLGDILILVIIAFTWWKVGNLPSRWVRNNEDASSSINSL